MTSTASLPDAGSAAGSHGAQRTKPAGRNGSSSEGGAATGFRNVLAGLDGVQRTNSRANLQDAPGTGTLSVLAGRIANAELMDEPGTPDAANEKLNPDFATADKSPNAEAALLAEIWPAIQRSAQRPEQGAKDEAVGEIAQRQHLPSDEEMAANLPAGRAKVSVTRQEVHFEPTGLTSTARPENAAQQAQGGAASLSAIINGDGSKSQKVGSGEPRDRASAITAASGEADVLPDATATTTIQSGGRDRGSKEMAGREDHRSLAVPAPISSPAEQSSSAIVPAPLTEQIVDRVAAEMADLESLSRAPSTSATTTSVSTQGTVLKVLHIKLEPENLGTVTVRLSLKDNALEMQLEASRPETAELLARDRDALSNLMRSAGYSIDTTTVASSARTDSGSNAGTSSSPGGQPQGDLSAQQQGSSGSERRGNDARHQQPGTPDINRTTDTEPHETGNRTRGNGAMYV